MSAHSPWLQFVTRLPDSPKMEEKGVVLVRGPWYETLSSLGLPFDVISLLCSQVGLSSVETHVLLDALCTDIPLFF